MEVGGKLDRAVRLVGGKNLRFGEKAKLQDKVMVEAQPHLPTQSRPVSSGRVRCVWLTQGKLAGLALGLDRDVTGPDTGLNWAREDRLSGRSVGTARHTDGGTLAD